eukprot:7666490-Pyramimonas_sp.AAC.1
METKRRPPHLRSGFEVVGDVVGAHGGKVRTQLRAHHGPHTRVAERFSRHVRAALVHQTLQQWPTMAGSGR